MTQENLTCDWCGKKLKKSFGYTNHIKACRARIKEQGKQFGIKTEQKVEPPVPKRVFVPKDKIKIDYELDATDRDVLSKKIHRQLLHDLSTRFGESGPVIVNLSPDEAKGLINLLEED